ncbi:MAG: HAD family hydrolase [Thioalkalivibrionaceae bacterium]
MKTPDIRSVTFDLDDTLWPVMPVIERAERSFLDWCRTAAPVIANTFDLQELTVCRTAFMRSVDDHRRIDLTTLRRSWMRALAIEHGCDPDCLESTGFEVFWLARCAPEPFPEVVSVLDALASERPLGAITNGNACVFRTGLGRYFDFSVSAIEAGASKKDSDPFYLAIQRAGVQASQILHIGDDPINDVIAAQRAGLAAIWFNPKRQSWPTELGPTPPSIGRLGQLVERFDQLATLASTATATSQAQPITHRTIASKRR